MKGTLVVGVAVVLLAAACASDGGGGGGAADEGPDDAAVGECDWPMWGQSPERRFSSPSSCATDLSPDSVGDLEEAWFFNTEDVVTATPAVVGDTVYVGDWTGRFYALDRDDGDPRWTFDAPRHERVYAGQIVSSAAVADVAGARTVYFGAGKTLFALDGGSGEVTWRHELNPDGEDDDPTEIETSPVVVDGPDGQVVLVGYDGHNTPGVRAGVVALDAATGAVLWDFDPDRGRAPTGCVDVWSSPAVDVGRGLVYFGTGNCNTSPEDWTRFTEALIAVHLDTGRPAWTYQPHEPNNDDLDFGATPNLFAAGGHDLVGIGNKDGDYYAVDRDSGELVWQADATEPGLNEPGSNFSTGGFIGPAAVLAVLDRPAQRGDVFEGGDQVIVGGTAVGPCPCLHGIDTATGDVAWQQDLASPTYAATAGVRGVAFSGGTDFTFRAIDAARGDVLWEHEMSGPVAGGAAIQGNDVFAVAGLREPGQDIRAENSGVYRFTLPGDDGPTTTTEAAAPTTTAVPIEAFSDDGQDCVGEPCDFAFSLKDPPAGIDPRMSLRISADPASVTVQASGLGPPQGWLRPGSPAANAGASSYAVFLSKGVDNPNGALVCVLEPVDDTAAGDGDSEPGAMSCETDAIADLGSDFDRLSVLAVDDATTLPPIAEGYDRLVDTISFDPPLRPAP